MYFTDEEYRNIQGVIEEIRKTIKNSSSSSLSINLIRVVELIGKKYFPTLCSTCSSGRFNLLTRIHTLYNMDTIERNKIEEENERKERERREERESSQKKKTNTRKNTKSPKS